MTGLTLDTGALAAIDRCDRRVLALVTVAQMVTIPALVVIEWLGRRETPDLLDAFAVEPLSVKLAEVAGVALSRVEYLLHAPTVVHAMVMASAAQRGDVVLTSNRDRLSLFQPIFTNVRLIKV